VIFLEPPALRARFILERRPRSLTTPLEPLFGPTPPQPVGWAVIRDAAGTSGWFGPLRGLHAWDQALPTLGAVAHVGRWARQQCLPLAIQAALDGAAWDLACRQRQLTLWQLLGRPAPTTVRHYASVLSVPTSSLADLPLFIDDGWSTLKVSLRAPVSPSDAGWAQQALYELARQRCLALDLHRRDDLFNLRLNARLTRRLGWLEDPPAGWSWPAEARVVVGEHADDERALRAALRSGAWGVQVEPSRLGVSRILVLAQEVVGRCRLLLHGHLPQPAVAIAAACEADADVLVEHSLRWRPARTPGGADISPLAVPTVGLGAPPPPWALPSS
jgi:L-alanine-DL-glutamate epimerase-like enolase superfamily enzyme